MDTIYNLQKRSDELRKKTETDSITPDEVGGLHADTLAYLADMEQNIEGLGIKRVYESYAAMTAEGEEPTGTNGKLLKFGQLVIIYDAENTTQAETGNIYAWQKGTGAEAWLQVGNISRIDEMHQAIVAASAGVSENAQAIAAEAAARTDADTALQSSIDSVIKTVELTALDTMVESISAGGAMAKDTGHARWTVTQGGVKVGVLELFSDGSRHQLTQVLTSNYNAVGGTFAEHYDNEVRTYYRVYNMTSPSLENAKGTWSEWAEVVPKTTQNWIEHFREYEERTVALTQAEYDALVAAGTVDDETYYNIFEEDES